MAIFQFIVLCFVVSVPIAFGAAGAYFAFQTLIDNDASAFPYKAVLCFIAGISLNFVLMLIVIDGVRYDWLLVTIIPYVFPILGL